MTMHGIWNFRSQHLEWIECQPENLRLKCSNSPDSESFRMIMGSEISEVNILECNQTEILGLKYPNCPDSRMKMRSEISEVIIIEWSQPEHPGLKCYIIK